MKTRPNLKTRQYLSLLIWVLYFGVGFLINFTPLEKYYGPIWGISTLIALTPYLYWAYLPVKIADTASIIRYYKLTVVLLVLSLLLLISSLILSPPTVDNDQEIIPTVSGFLFSASLIGCFVFGARSLVQQERKYLSKPSNGLMAFFMFFYLPIGIFFLVPRLKKLYESSLGSFD